MTDAEWLECAEPQAMLDSLRGKASERKLRLLACGCVRRMWRYLDSPTRQALEYQESHADGGEGREHAVSGQRSHWITGSARDAAGYAIRTFGRPETKARADLLRCVFGNLSCSVTLSQKWLTTLATKLANAIYDDHAFDRLPILADALEDAGCTDADILNHYRQPGPHARGCWVVDLLLGKE
jgi:hypothetical protein